MISEKVDKKAKTIVLETDYVFTEFEVNKYREHFHFNFIKDKCQSMGSYLFMNRFNGRKYYPKEIEIINVDLENGKIDLKYT